MGPTAELKTRYECHLRDLAVEVQILSRALRADPSDGPSIERLRWMAHQLGGTAGLFGLSALSEAAQALEALLTEPVAPLGTFAPSMQVFEDALRSGARGFSPG